MHSDLLREITVVVVQNIIFTGENVDYCKTSLLYKQGIVGLGAHETHFYVKDFTTGNRYVELLHAM